MNSKYPLLILQCKRENVSELAQQVRVACVNNETLVISDSVKVYAFDEKTDAY